MYTARINSNTTINVVPKNTDNTWEVNGAVVKIDVIKLGENNLHVLMNNKSYRVTVMSADRNSKSFVFKINNQKVDVVLSDKYDELLKKLGIDNADSTRLNDLKAPMPGLVVDVFVDAGQTIKKGEPLLVLEAMKMENVLKSDADGTVKAVEVKKGSKVEKNEVLVHFE